MIVGIGVDVVDVARFHEAWLRRGERFLARIFTDGERRACRDRADAPLALAARFAAKEACMKALGTGWSQGVAFTEIEVVREPRRPPVLRLQGEARRRCNALGAERLHLSLSHTETTAVAMVVLEKSADQSGS